MTDHKGNDDNAGDNDDARRAGASTTQSPSASEPAGDQDKTSGRSPNKGTETSPARGGASGKTDKQEPARPAAKSDSNQGKESAAPPGQKPNEKPAGSSGTATSGDTAGKQDAPESVTPASNRGGRTDGSSTGGGSGDRDSNGRDSDGKKGRRGGKAAAVVAVIALLIAIVALAGSGWLWYRGQDRLNAFDQRIETLRGTLGSSIQEKVMPRLAELQSRVDQVAGSNRQLSDKLSGQQAELQALQAKLQELQTELRNTQLQIAGMAQRLQGSARRAHLNQIEHLLVVANRRLQLYSAPQQAISALRLAGNAIARLNDPRLMKVRKRIIDAIAALNALPSPDIEGIVLTLTSFIEQVAGLPLAADVPTNYQEAVADQAGGGAAAGGKTHGGISWTERWQNFVGSVSTALQSMVTIRHTGGSQPALLPPQQVYFLTQNLKLELRAARLALLERNTTLYRTSLATAIDWLKEYYETDDPAVSAMIDRLQQMQNIKLDWQPPDISAPLAALRDYMRARNREDSRPADGSRSTPDATTVDNTGAASAAPQQGQE